ncbi:MAG: alginate lyase family protein [Anaerolineaceae bacterium]
MSVIDRFRTGIKAAAQLGLPSVFNLALYRFGLVTGHYRRLTPIQQLPTNNYPFKQLPLPDRDKYRLFMGDATAPLLREADEILSGKVRLFGGPPVELQLVPPGTLHHWTDYELGKAAWGMEDVKFLWEPARFGWALTLARAYLVSDNNSYAQYFWEQVKTFLEKNPANLGPNWASAQEVALRLICLALAMQVFHEAPATTGRREQALIAALYQHAARIPVTLPYARAQNNNHLLSEAAGLYTAGVLFEAANWQQQGWKLFNHALQSQIASDGTYVQHSTNYHRLMLQLALWVQFVARTSGMEFPLLTKDRLAAATRWLMTQLDDATGRVPNLGSNDGAYVLPLARGDFDDYRPVVQAASRAFLNEPYLPPGPRDEYSLWMGLPNDQSQMPSLQSVSNPAIHRLGNAQTWATLRAVRFTSRPFHADQLHVDLWWRGQAIALDAGTFQYNAAPPWDNALAVTAVHNTVTVDDRDQMLRAGRFLWLDWAQATLLSEEQNALTAEHDGYRKLGILHRRRLECQPPQHWLVADILLPTGASLQEHRFRLHWLLPDWPWKLEGGTLKLTPPAGSITLRIEVENDVPGNAEIQLVRGGEQLVGTGRPNPIMGWYSPTYSQRQPALSLVVEIKAVPPVKFKSLFELPD